MTNDRKANLVAQIQKHLETELVALETALRAAEDAATHEESKPENKYDTRGLEASYLAGAQRGRAAELRGMLDLLGRTRLKVLSEADALTPTALVELECEGVRGFYLLAAVGAGAALSLDGQAVLAITPASPLGRALLGKHVGDVVTIKVPQGAKDYEIMAVE